MSNLIKLLPALLFLSAFFGCKKEGPPKFCWQKVDNFGNKLEVICSKTEAEMQMLYPNSCSYFKAGGEKFCWMRNGVFIKDASQEEIDYVNSCFGATGTATKVDCSYCGRWYHREKRTYKPAGTATYSEVRVENFCGDTAKTIFQGRQVIIRETTDSLIVRQFSNNGTNW
ncbi:MAG TPA: hypothetical protein VGB71_00170 [Flavisolibacter sp.]|jgi:hypothetical protein